MGWTAQFAVAAHRPKDYIFAHLDRLAVHLAVPLEALSDDRRHGLEHLGRVVAEWHRLHRQLLLCGKAGVRNYIPDRAGSRQRHLVKTEVDEIGVDQRESLPSGIARTALRLAQVAAESVRNGGDNC